MVINSHIWKHLRPQGDLVPSIKTRLNRSSSSNFSKSENYNKMMLSKLLILLLGEGFCFPNALARSRRQSMQQVQKSLINELQKEIPVFHFPQQQSQATFDKKSVYEFDYRQRQEFNAAGYRPRLTNKQSQINDFFNLYQQMYQREW